MVTAGCGSVSETVPQTVPQTVQGYPLRAFLICMVALPGVTDYRAAANEFGESSCTFTAPDGYRWMWVSV